MSSFKDKTSTRSHCLNAALAQSWMNCRDRSQCLERALASNKARSISQDSSLPWFMNIMALSELENARKQT